MADRSAGMGVALLLAPTVGVIAIRFGIPALEEVLKEDLLSLFAIHGVAIFLGVIMFMRYRVVEDHEYHRSSAIKNLRKMYKMEDKGLWSKGDAAVERLEEKAKAKPKGRAALLRQARITGRISDLNSEGQEMELDESDERMNIEVSVEGMVQNKNSENQNLGSNETNTGFFARRAEASAQRRLNRENSRLERKAEKEAKRAAKRSQKEAKEAAKAEKRSLKKNLKNSNRAAKKDPIWDSEEENQWSAPLPSSLAKSVVTCKECGGVNNTGVSYCISCGAFL